MTFIRIGDHIIGLNQIAAIYRYPYGTLRVSVVGSANALSFGGDEATALWDWICNAAITIAITPKPAEHETTPGNS